MTTPAQMVAETGPLTSRALAGAVWRNNIRLFRNSASLVSALVMPGMSMLSLWVVFGHAARQSGFDYALFLMAASMFQAVMFTAAGSAMALAVDVENGLLDRLRAMPIRSTVVVGGRMITDMLRSVVSLITVTTIALVCGAQPHSFGGLLVSYLIALLMGEILVLAFCGLALRSSHPVRMAALIQVVEMPLLMVSTAFIPLVALPGWLAPIIEHMPFSVMIDTNRAFLNGTALAGPGWQALAWLAAGLVLGSWWVAGAFRRRA